MELLYVLRYYTYIEVLDFKLHCCGTRIVKNLNIDVLDFYEGARIAVLEY